MRNLWAEEARVLGCLLEKERTTPDLYPLTLNALVTACNQTTNRDPVVRYADTTVQAALDSLRAEGLTRIVYSPSNRAPKHRQVAEEVLGLGPGEAAVACLLLLRGPQTSGELRTRSERLHPFAGVDDVEAALDALARRDEPLVTRLERVPGQKEARWATLLVELPDPATTAAPAAAPRADRVAALEADVADLRAEVAELRSVVDQLRTLLD